MRLKRELDENSIINEFIDENIPETERKELSSDFRKAVTILSLKPNADVSSLIKKEEIPLAEDIARRFYESIRKSLPKVPILLSRQSKETIRHPGEFTYH